MVAKRKGILWYFVVGRVILFLSMLRQTSEVLYFVSFYHGLRVTLSEVGIS